MAGQMISPGVYTRIIDLSQYLADTPGTVGFVPILSKRGPDNKLMLVTSNEQFYNLYGEPNILDYGTAFGQGPYIAAQHLSVSSQLYVLRALPSDATYAHVVVGMQNVTWDLVAQGGSSSSEKTDTALQMYPIYLTGEPYTYYPDQAHQTVPADGGSELKTSHIKNLETLFSDSTVAASYLHFDYNNGNSPDGDGPYSTNGTAFTNGILMYFRTNGRGASYNDFSIRLQKSADSQKWGIYVLNIYEIQSDGSNVITESYNVSFDPTAVDSTGESIFIEDVVNKFSTNIIVSVNRTALNQLFIDDGSGESPMMKFYKNDPTIPDYITDYVVLDDNGQKTELGYKATAIETARMNYDYAKTALDAALSDLTDARALPSSTSEQIEIRNSAINIALTEVSNARAELIQAQTDILSANSLDIMTMGTINSTTGALEPWQLQEGSEGSLTYLNQTNGKVAIQTTEATQVLSDAYVGLLVKPDDKPKVDANGNVSWGRTKYVDEVLDLEWIYFSLVYDAGYPVDVKIAAEALAETYRLDCMLITDCGDNNDFYDCQSATGNNPNEDGGLPMDTKYAARYEPYSKVYDTYVGRDTWFTPVYHMAQLVPLNDRLYNIWYASAGFNRGTLSNIKELRWSAKLPERDLLYLMQVNPIVHFPEGYTVWGNLTTQKRPSALQDINIMRMVLYIKRALEQYCKYFIFEFNDQTTWDQIKQGIIPFLDTIKASRGLTSFGIDVGATDWEFKNKICHVNVILEPTKVIEKIELNLFVK
jgi:hypothetical protein